MKQNYDANNSLKRRMIRQANLICCFILLTGLSGALKAQQTYTFTSAGGLGGRFGPTPTQVTNSYLSTNLAGLVTSTNGVQSFTVTGGLYRITAIGARGGNNTTYYGGYGASMQGDFNLPPGAVVNILVGQHGEFIASSGYNGGGGGGSFVWVNGQTLPLVAAGGGGGQGAAYAGVDAVLTTSGTAGNGATQGTPGTNGNGANPGGAGWFTDGAAFVGSGTGCGTKCTGGTSGTTPGGASPTTCIVGIALQGCGAMPIVGDGGFGGGSGGNGNCSTSFGAGGGGGYSGGVGQPDGTLNANALGVGGGGGGSYNGGTNQVNAISTRTADGIVIIQELCNISLTASGSNSLNPSICSGQSLSLTTNAISNYSWSTGNTTNSVIVVSPLVTTVYTLSGTSPANCIAAKSITVIVSPALPVLTITNTPNTMCLGKTATLTAAGAVTYTWTGGSVPVTNGQAFIPTATQVYTVTGQNGCGNSIATTTITIAPLVVTASTNSALVCSGSTTTLTANAAVNGFTWMPTAITGSNAVVAPFVNTIYTVAASDGTCFGTATVAVNTKPVPSLTIAVTSTNVCEGTPITLTASGASTYSWSWNSSNSTGATLSDNPVIPTSYLLTGVNSVNCISQASQIVLVMAAPAITIAATKTLACSGGSVILTASGANTYNWVSGPATATNLVNPVTATGYTVTGTGTNSCSGDKTITINVLTANVAVSAPVPSICPGGSATLTASGANSYTWTGTPSINGTAIVTPAATTIYSVTANTTTPGLSCQSSNNITITVFNSPSVTIVATKTVVCKTDAAVTLTGGGATTYTWSTNTVSTAISVHPQITTTYSVFGTDANGCENNKSVQITVNPCTSIGEITGIAKGILIYPNPNNGTFDVSSTSDLDLKLINELGQEIRNIRLNGQNDHTVSVSGLANGVYFVVGQNSTEKISQKITVANK